MIKCLQLLRKRWETVQWMYQSFQWRKFITPRTHSTHHPYLYRPIHVHIQYGRFSLDLPDIFNFSFVSKVTLDSSTFMDSRRHV